MQFEHVGILNLAGSKYASATEAKRTTIKQPVWHARTHIYRRNRNDTNQMNSASYTTVWSGLLVSVFMYAYPKIPYAYVYCISLFLRLSFFLLYYQYICILFLLLLLIFVNTEISRTLRIFFIFNSTTNLCVCVCFCFRLFIVVMQFHTSITAMLKIKHGAPYSAPYWNWCQSMRALNIVLSSPNYKRKASSWKEVFHNWRIWAASCAKAPALHCAQPLVF